MLDDRGARRVLVGYADGRTLAGQVSTFSPYGREIILRSSDGQSPERRQHITPEAVSYVGFLPGGTPLPPLPPDVSTVRVHLMSQIRFDVALVGGADKVGFYGRPVDSSSPFEELFLYSHSVLAREDLRPIGAILVAQGSIDSTSLERALETQQANRSAKIGEILLDRRELDQASLERALALQQRQRMRLGEILVEAGLVTEAQIQEALAEQRHRKGKRIGEILVDMGFLSDEELGHTLARKFNLEFVDLDKMPASEAAKTVLPLETIQRYRVLPLAVDATSITIALSDPLATEAVDFVGFQLGRRVNEVVVAASQLRRYIEQRAAGLGAVSAEDGTSMAALLTELGRGDEDAAASNDAIANTESAPLVKLVEQILADGHRRGASDIHIEPNGRSRPTLVRFRVDGECMLYQEVPPAWRAPLIARLKIIAGLDIAERRKPQDGKIRITVEQRQVELRLATIPTANGDEDAVLRILASAEPLPLASMKLSARNLAELKLLVQRPYGLILCVGPTGSGKTTTLHSALGAINTMERKIWTAEDPVEISQSGLRQVQVNPRIGFTFAAAMRAFLRADPDVIMVGEMRDQETAAIAVEASLTGHLVLSTLHTNSAPETITRLLDMGLDAFTFADALLGVLAQRLTRALCKACCEPYEPSPREYAQLSEILGAERLDQRLATGGPPRLCKARGCAACGGSGYKGRLALHELLVVDDEMRRGISRRSAVQELRQQAMDAGMTTLMQDGAEKALAGLTDMTQVFSVCSR